MKLLLDATALTHLIGTKDCLLDCLIVMATMYSGIVAYNVLPHLMYELDCYIFTLQNWKLRVRKLRVTKTDSDLVLSDAELEFLTTVL